MRLRLELALLGLVVGTLAHLFWRTPAIGAEPTPVVHETKKPNPKDDFLEKRVAYTPDRREEPFFQKLPADQVSTDLELADVRIDKHEGKYVGWFGIVRNIEIDEKNDRTILHVEHKYFDGKTDPPPRMTVSFSGAGEFRAVLSGTRSGIELLTLVRVYGTVAKGEAGDNPQVDAAFVRNWSWGSFAFENANGEQRGSEKWRRLNQRGLSDDLHAMFPKDDYYHQVLGHRTVFDDFRKRLLAAAGDVPADTRPILSELVEAVRNDHSYELRHALKLLENDHAERAADALLVEALRIGDKTAHLAAVRGRALRGTRTPVEHEWEKPTRRDDGILEVEYVPDRGVEIKNANAKLLELIFGKWEPRRPETPFFRRLPPIRTDVEGEGHTIDKHEGKFVGWFGIVREIEIDEKNDRTILTVEHKYFNGRTDNFPRMTVSYNGSGDFRAALNGTHQGIQLLTLVRVYGAVAKGTKDAIPTVEAEFVKNWYWGSFAFSEVAYWPQLGSAKWRRLREPSRLYSAFPDTTYYREVLGYQPVLDEFRKRLLTAAGDVPADTKPVISELIEALRLGRMTPVSRMLKLLKEDHAERAAGALLEEALRSGDKTARAAAAKGKEELEAK